MQVTQRVGVGAGPGHRPRALSRVHPGKRGADGVFSEPEVELEALSWWQQLLAGVVQGSPCSPAVPRP